MEEKFLLLIRYLHFCKQIFFWEDGGITVKLSVCNVFGLGFTKALVQEMLCFH